jgi:hypothetical protein
VTPNAWYLIPAICRENKRLHAPTVVLSESVIMGWVPRIIDHATMRMPCSSAPSRMLILAEPAPEPTGIAFDMPFTTLNCNDTMSRLAFIATH